jgi:hypothetical protein
MQETEVMYASTAAQRRAAPVYRYEPEKFVSGLWVLSKWEHQRFVESHPELFSNRYGAATGDAGEPSTVMHQLPTAGAPRGPLPTPIGRKVQLVTGHRVGQEATSDSAESTFAFNWPLFDRGHLNHRSTSSTAASSFTRKRLPPFARHARPLVL